MIFANCNLKYFDCSYKSNHKEYDYWNFLTIRLYQLIEVKIKRFSNGTLG